MLREAGASTYFQKLLRRTTLATTSTDQRRIDVLAVGLPVYKGAPLFCDATLRSPVTAKGDPRFHSDEVDGATLAQAVTEKRRRYADVNK